ncbi:uncharacterized protein LOC127102575 [Lathyrus oleraceus]|uniref:uncharacterized protein LOC127102575 n=1 Tax=Pisum sativum TaxID=3888 RepID=UPI0021D15A5B|nr:uncharacterized protein LOC127102575 [Pisum sativum]
MSSIEQMTHLIDGFKTQSRMLLDASVEGTLRLKVDEELKTMIENICQNEYYSREHAMKQKGIHAVNSTITLSSQIEALNKQFVASQLAQYNVSHIQILRRDCCGGEHANGSCTIEVESAEVQYVNFQKNNSYSNTYNTG